MNTSVIQSQLCAKGIDDFCASRVSPARSDVREFLASRKLIELRQPDAPILKMVYPALQRLANVPLSETIYRWEAESELGRIVGYSTEEMLIGVFPWIMKNKYEWVGSMILF